ncbi:UNVERIFIED_CONTAM: hypothetical protein FKN15_078174 [Acipenser sinensis]
MYEDVTNSSQSTVLQLACALFVLNGTKLSSAFAQYVSSWVNSSLQQANFSEPNRTRTQISQWVHSQSGVKHVLGIQCKYHRALDGFNRQQKSSRGSIEVKSLSCDPIGSTLTQIAMVNTVFFKSTWQKQFLFTDSEPALHHRRRIHLKSQFKTPAEQRFAMVELSYLGNAVSMLIVLPSERKTSLSLIEPYITA